MAVIYVDSQTLYNDPTVTYDGKKTNYLTLSAGVEITSGNTKKSISLQGSAFALLSYFPHREIRAVARVALYLAPSYNKIGNFLRTFTAQVGVLGGAYKRLFLAAKEASLSLTSGKNALAGKNLPEADINLGSSRLIFVKKNSNAAVQIDSSEEKEIEGSTTGEIILSVGVIKESDKHLDSPVSFSASGSKETSKQAGSAIEIISDVVNKIEKVLAVDINLDSLTIGAKEKTLEAEVGLEAMIQKEITKILLFDIDTSSEEEKENKHSFASSFSAGADMEMFVKKTNRAVINISGDTEEQAEKVETLTASLTLGASVIANKNGRIVKGITINIPESQSTKMIGKTFTIREHAPSVWHNC